MIAVAGHAVRHATSAGDAAAKARLQPQSIALPCGHVHVLRTPTPGIFVLGGSFRPHPGEDDRDALLLRLVTTATNAGSLGHDQFRMAELLENRGAWLSIEADPHRATFAARACTEDFALVASLLGECLREPMLSDEDIAAEQSRLTAQWRSESGDPQTLAMEALGRAMHAPGHPLHVPTVPTRIALLETLTAEDARRCHRERFGPEDLQIAVVGDVDPDAVARMLATALAGWERRAAPPARTRAPWSPPAPAVRRIAAPDRETFEAALGHALSIRGDDPDYWALRMGDLILGGGFGSQLVTQVRERRGLTYAIHSALSKPWPDCEGHWRVGVSLSRDALEPGLAATRETIARVIEDGTDAQALALRRQHGIGSFRISLATLGGLAETMLSGVECGWGADHIHTCPDAMAAVDVADVNRCLRTYLRPESLHVTVAGPFESLAADD